jgi:hypothetical protein
MGMIKLEHLFKMQDDLFLRMTSHPAARNRAGVYHHSQVILKGYIPHYGFPIGLLHAVPQPYIIIVDIGLRLQPVRLLDSTSTALINNAYVAMLPNVYMLLSQFMLL